MKITKYLQTFTITNVYEFLQLTQNTIASAR